VDLHHAVASLGKAVTELNELIEKEFSDSPDMEPKMFNEYAEALIELHSVKAELKVVYDSFAWKIQPRIDDYEPLTLGNGLIEKSYNTRRTGWQHKDLANAVAQRISSMAIDMDTGEVKASTEEMITKLLDYIQPNYWKVGELRKIGLNADNYCETGDTRISLIIRKGKQEESNDYDE
jgi:hypothetical protein